MKGAEAVPLSAPLKHFIVELDKLAANNFPAEGIIELFKTGAMGSDIFEPYTFFLQGRYTRNLIHKCPMYELILMCWAPHQKSPIHGHEGEKCFLRVQAGELLFTNYAMQEKGAEVILEPLNSAIGRPGFVDGPAIIHRVANESDSPAISLHLYARPFAQCDIFDEKAHTKQRATLGYDSEGGRRCFSV